MAPGLGDGGQAFQVWPGPFGVDVVGGDRRDAAPVVDAGVEEDAEVVGQVGWGLEVDVWGEDDPGQGNGLAVGVVGAGGLGVHGRPRLGQEVLDDHLLDVAVTSV